MKIYTCALKAFTTPPYFFTRDSGLLCRHLQAMNVDSMVVLPALADADEYPCEDVTRAPERNLTSPEWWKSQEIDAVAIVTWGHQEGTSMIAAAKSSGTLVMRA